MHATERKELFLYELQRTMEHINVLSDTRAHKIVDQLNGPLVVLVENGASLLHFGLDELQKPCISRTSFTISPIVTYSVSVLDRVASRWVLVMPIGTIMTARVWHSSRCCGSTPTMLIGGEHKPKPTCCVQGTHAISYVNMPTSTGSRYAVYMHTRVDMLAQEVARVGSTQVVGSGFYFPTVNVVGAVLQYLDECHTRAVVIAPTDIST